MTSGNLHADPGLSDLRISPEDRGTSAPSHRKKWIIVAGVAFAAVVAAAVAFTDRRVAVVVTEARPAAGAGARPILNASGYVTPRRRATVASKITGRVAQVLVEEGMVVRAGDVLARLDDAEARAAFDSARADRDAAASAVPEVEVDLRDAEKTLARTAELATAGYTDQQSLDRAEAARDGLRARLARSRSQVKAAEARMALSARDLENCVVRAPFSGVAVSKDAQPGEIVSPVSAGGGFTRTGISTIVDMESLEVEVDVNESYLAKVSSGQRVEATLDAYPDWKIPASVRTVIPTADRQKATVKVRIAFDALDPRILPDMGVKVTFLAEPKPGTAPAGVLLPKEAVLEEGGAKVAYVLKDGRLSRRTVTLGEIYGTEANVTAGVSPGEKVVIKGSDGLGDGMKAGEKK